ncbi:MAG: sodium-dependent transporter [Pseudomonadota bacterium]
MAKRLPLQGLWSNRMAFVLAVSGSAVGLGNIWKFPYITGQNGGGAFVLVYLFCVFAIGMPIMMSEIMIGRRGRRNPITTMRLVGEEESGHAWWQIIGIGGTLAGCLILSFYSVVAGWALAYIFKSVSGVFMGSSAADVAEVFSSFTGSWPSVLLWYTAFLGMTVAIVANGVQRGLEKAVRILMPALMLLLLVLVVFSWRHGDFEAGFSFMFASDFSKLTPNSVLVALGHAFFTLSIGMGAVMAYGAYLPEDSSIASASLAVVIVDTLIALVAGLVIFPLVFANGLSPAEGAGLMFKSMPLAFGAMPGGAVFGALFFALLTFAAWTSSIGLIEPAVSWMVEARHFSRVRAALTVGGLVWLLGIATVLSFSALSDFTFLRGTLYDNIDFLASNILLPVGGLLITVFAGWVVCRNSSADELAIGTGFRFRLWRALTRLVAPLAVLLILLNAVGVLNLSGA